MRSHRVLRSPRPRRGRFLVEALVALALAAAAFLFVASVAGSALAMGDAATEFDRAAQSALAAGADALRAPCGPMALAPVAPWSVRHQSTRVTTAGEIRLLEVTDRWLTVGIGRHDARVATAEIGVRCD